MAATARTGASYIAPSTGIPALRDAIALIRCAAAEDAEGTRAILDGTTTAPWQLATTLAAVAVGLCRRCGLSNRGISAVLGELGQDVTDMILDQPCQPRPHGNAPPSA
jgi:hypothetical protein